MAISPTTLESNYAEKIGADGLSVIDFYGYEDIHSVDSVQSGRVYFEMSWGEDGISRQDAYLVVGLECPGTNETPRRRYSISVADGSVVRDAADYAQEYITPHPNTSTTGTIGVYFNADTAKIGFIMPAGDTGYITTLDGATGPLRVFVARTGYEPMTPWVFTMNFGASPFVYEPPAGYEFGFGVPASNVDGFASLDIYAPSPVVSADAGASASVVAPMANVSAYLAGALYDMDLTAPAPSVLAYAGASAQITAALPFIQSAVGVHLAITAPSPTLRSQGHDSTGEQSITCTAPPPVLSFYTGAVAKNLRAPSPTLSTTGTVTGWGGVELSAPKPTLAAEGTVTGMARAYLKYGWDYGASNYRLESFGGGNATAKPSAPRLSATCTVGSAARVLLTAPRTGLTSYDGASLTLTPSVATLSARALRGSNASVALTASSPELSVVTGVRISLTPSFPKLSARALRGGNASAVVTAPSPTLSSTSGIQVALNAPAPSLVATGYPCGSEAHLSAPRPNLVGYGGAVCGITLTGKVALIATGTAGGTASVAATCPLFELTATASIGNVASATLLAPSPQLGRTLQAWLVAPSARLTAIGSAVITATYEAYTVNLGHRPRVTNQELPIDEVTRYTNFPFTHVVRYQNSYYGANSTGLYLLEGTTDDGTAIPWAVKTAMDDFKTPVKKTVASAYFGGRFGPASTVQLHAGEQSPNTYSYTTPRDALAQNHRQVFGKGVKERYYALGASGTGDLELDTIELETHNMTRRI